MLQEIVLEFVNFSTVNTYLTQTLQLTEQLMDPGKRGGI